MMSAHGSRFSIIAAAACVLGIVGATVASAQQPLRLYGPLGTNMAVEEAAVVYAARNNLEIKVVSGPADEWRSRANQDGDLFFCTGEYIMSTFVGPGGPVIDKMSTTPLYVRPAVILVRPGNPKDIRDFPDLLRPGLNVMMVNASGQTGLWENMTGKLQSLPNLVALEKNTEVCAHSPEEAMRVWKQRSDIDAWLAWNVWHIPRRDVARVVPISKDYQIYRKCSISLMARANANPTAAGFMEYLASEEGAEVFESWGWTKAPPDANPALAENGVFVACRIAHDDWANDVGRGLKRVLRLVQDYRCLGVPADQIHLCAVFDADAGYWMLQNPAYAAFTGKRGANPNRPIIHELTNLGVALELSAAAMKEHGWTEDDVLPGVTIVPDATTRLTDLGRHGYDFLPL